MVQWSHVRPSPDRQQRTRQWHFDRTEVIGAKKRVIGPSAHIAQHHRFAKPGMIGSHNQEDPWRHLPNAVVHDAHPVEDAAILAKAENRLEEIAVGLRAVHATHVRHQARSVRHSGHLYHRLAAIDELDQHVWAQATTRGLLSPGRISRPGMAIEGIVLSLASRNDREAKGVSEVIELLARGGLITRSQRVQHPFLFRIPPQQWPNRDVGLHVHHRQVFAGAHGMQGST